MPSPATNTRATLIPCLRYRDASAAIEWLCKAFGFEKMLVVPEGKDRIAHAQLSFGNGMIMLGSVSDNAYGRLLKQPDEIGGAQTQTVYAIVTDPDAVYVQAKAAGAAAGASVELLLRLLRVVVRVDVGDVEGTVAIDLHDRRHLAKRIVVHLARQEVKPAGG